FAVTMDLQRTIYVSFSAGGGGVLAVSSDFRCVPGYYWSFGSCVECPLGSYRSISLLSYQECASCPTGSVANTTGSQSCAECEPGTFFISAALSCQSCQEGFFSDGYGRTYCLACPSGTYGNRTGLSTSI